MGKYKHGKQTELLNFQTFQEKMNKAQLTEEEAGFLWGLYYCGARKSELYERVAEDCRLILTTGAPQSFPLPKQLANPDSWHENYFFQIDFKARKKHGSTVPPLELPLSWPGVTLLVKLAQKAAARSAFHKSLFIYEDSKEMKTLKSGKQKAIKKRTLKSKIGHYLFPNVQSTRAWQISKEVLGPEFYPHFFRLNRLTEIATDPGSNLTRLKSYSGIKTTEILEAYLGTSKKEQQAAMSFMNEKFKEK